MRGVALAALILCATHAYAEVMITNSARVTGGASAVVSTGGNRVGPGGVVETGGAEARAMSESIVTGEDSVVETTIETVTNGVRSVESSVTEVPDGTVTVLVATSSRTGGIIVRDSSTSSPSMSDTTREPETVPAAPQTVSTASFMHRIQSFFDRLFTRVSLFAWWR